MVYGSQDVHQHSVVRSLVEFSLLGLVIFIEYLSNKLKNFGHELVLVKAEHLQ